MGEQTTAQQQLAKLIGSWDGDTPLAIPAGLAAAIDTETPTWPAGAWATRVARAIARQNGKDTKGTTTASRYADGHLELCVVPADHFLRRPHRPVGDEMCECCGADIATPDCFGWEHGMVPGGVARPTS